MMNLMVKRIVVFIFVVFAFCISPAFTQTAVRIMNQLGQGQIIENVKITIGNSTQMLSVNQFQPIAYTDFYFSRPGVYSCRIESESQFYGESFFRRGFGMGELKISGGEILGLAANFSENPYQITLILVDQLQTAPVQNQVVPDKSQTPLTEAQKRLRIEQIDIQIRQLQGKINEEERRLKSYESSGDNAPSSTNLMLQQSILRLIQTYNYNIMMLEREKARLKGY